MNIPVISNVRPRIIMAPTYSVSASLTSTRISSPELKTESRYPNSQTRLPSLASSTFLFTSLHPMILPIVQVGRKPLFSIFCPTILTEYSELGWIIPNCSSPFTTLHLSCYQNNQRLLTSYGGLINSLNGFHHPLFSSFQLILDSVTRLKTSIGLPKNKTIWKRTKLEDSPSLISKLTTKHQQLVLVQKQTQQTNRNSTESLEISPHVYGQLILWQLHFCLREWWFGRIMGFPGLDRTSS